MAHHGAGLLRLTKNEALVEALKIDYRTADISAGDRAMLDYAAKVAGQPWSVSEGDIQALRDTGFDDRAILDINQITAYFAYVNRIASGLGVELEEYWGEKTEKS